MGSPFATALKRCSQCLFPETRETLFVDAETMHNMCRAQEVKAEIEWSERLQQLNALLAKCCDRYRYDYMMAFSGGKESTQAGTSTLIAKNFIGQQDQHPMSCRRHLGHAAPPIRLEAERC